MGIGFDKQFQKISSQELGDAILKAVQDKDIRSKAAKVAAQLRAERNGAECVADQVETFWQEQCVSGKFKEMFPAMKEA